MKNTGIGILYEISYSGDISGNYTACNGGPTNSVGGMSQIMICDSSGTNAHDNYVIIPADYGNGIFLTYYADTYPATGTYGPYQTINNSVYDNTLVCLGSTGQSGYIPWENFDTAINWPNTFSNNTYVTGSTDDQVLRWGWYVQQAAGDVSSSGLDQGAVVQIGQVDQTQVEAFLAQLTPYFSVPSGFDFPADVGQVISATADAQALSGGSGDDVYQLSGFQSVTISDTGGTDAITSSTTRDLTAFAGIENLTLTGSEFINGYGNDLDNVITGNAGENLLDGRGGQDTLIGGLGNDTMCWGGQRHGGGGSEWRLGHHHLDHQSGSERLRRDREPDALGGGEYQRDGQPMVEHADRQ